LQGVGGQISSPVMSPVPPRTAQNEFLALIIGYSCFWYPVCPMRPTLLPDLLWEPLAIGCPPPFVRATRADYDAPVIGLRLG
jgi:hypothetical protein